MAYTRSVLLILTVFWAVGSFLLAWFVRPLALIVFGSVALSAPAIIYAILGFGLPPTEAIIHAVVAGLYGLSIRYVMQRLRTGGQAINSKTKLPPTPPRLICHHASTAQSLSENSE